MVRRVLRVVLTPLALLMGVAGTQGLNRTNAGVGRPVECEGGTLRYFDHGVVTCYTQKAGICGIEDGIER
jgi:hypothetical protein